MEIPFEPLKTGQWRNFAGSAIIVFAAVIAAAPLFVRGASCGHDFDFHLVSWLDAQNAWRHGVLYPDWAASPNYGAGEPRFVFYPPLSWMLAAALGLALPWAVVPAVMTFLLLAATGLGTRALARLWLDEGAATLAGCAALFSPYALFTAYERSDFAELTGGLWIPLLLLLMLRESRQEAPEQNPSHSADAKNVQGGFFLRKKPLMRGTSGYIDSDSAVAWRRALDGSATLLALVMAGAWLCNAPLGLMACYMLCAVALALALLRRSWAPVLRAAAGGVAGMGLAGFYLVPAVWEQHWIDIRRAVDDVGARIESSWLFARHANPLLAGHDIELHKLSVLAVLMMVIAFCGLLVSWLRGRARMQRHEWIVLALIPLVVLLLQFSVSLPVWNLLPKLRFLQFPWRWLLVLEAPMAIFFAAAVWPERRGRRVAVAVVCAAIFLSVTAVAGMRFFQVCDDEDAVAPMLRVDRAGTGFAGYNEYAPLGVDTSLDAMGLPDACLTGDPLTALGQTTQYGDVVWNAGQGSCLAAFRARSEDWQPEAGYARIAVVAGHSGYLILRLLNYPAWRIKVNGNVVNALPQRDDGLMAVPVPKGAVRVSVDWTTTGDVVAGRWLSGLALLALAGLWGFERRKAWLRYDEFDGNECKVADSGRS